MAQIKRKEHGCGYVAHLPELCQPSPTREDAACGRGVNPTTQGSQTSFTTAQDRVKAVGL